MQNAVKHRIAQIDVAGCHVDLGAQDARAVGKLTSPHASEQVEVLVDAAIAIRAVAPRLGQCPAVARMSSWRLVVHIGFAGANQVLGPIVELLEIVRRVVEMLAPVEAEPTHVALDGIDVFLLLLGRIGVVEAQVAAAAEFLRDAEIEADRFGMPDVKIAVRLRREAGHDAAMPPRCQVCRNDVANEITAGFHCRRFGHSHRHASYLAPGSAVRALCGKLACRRQDALFWSDISPASYDTRASRVSDAEGSITAEPTRLNDSRYALCPLAYRLSAHRRRPDGAVQLALCARARRQNAAANRGHRSRAFDRTRPWMRSSTGLTGSAFLGMASRSPSSRAPRGIAKSPNNCWPAGMPTAAMQHLRSSRRCARRRAPKAARGSMTAAGATAIRAKPRRT